VRKVSAVATALFVMAATIVALALPASAGVSYPPTPTAPPQPASQAASRLAFTGSDSTPLVVIGLIALTLGAVLIVATRRRATVRAGKSA